MNDILVVRFGFYVCQVQGAVVLGLFGLWV